MKATLLMTMFFNPSLTDLAIVAIIFLAVHYRSKRYDDYTESLLGIEPT